MPFLRRCNLVLALLAGLPVPGRIEAQMKASGTAAPAGFEEISELRKKELLFPISGSVVYHLKDTFNEARPGHRIHHALDIPALCGTPVLSVDSGKVTPKSASTPRGSFTARAR